MTSSSARAKTKDEVAATLVAWHFEVEPELKQVFRIVSADNEADPAEPIKLLEVSGSTPATGSVETFRFSATKETPYMTVIAEVTPDEFDLIKKHEIKLPTGWSLDTAVLFNPPPTRR